MPIRVLATGLLLGLAACGGGGGGGGGPAPPTLNIAGATAPDGVIGTLYAYTVLKTGGSGAVTFSVSAGALPAGLSLDASTGTISGTPAGPAGTANFTLSAADSGSPQQRDSQAFTLDIATVIVINTGVAPRATIGVPYSHSIAVTGGTPPYQYFLSLPSGLTVDGNGVISGTPLPDALSQTVFVNIHDSAQPFQQVIVPMPLDVTLEVVSTSLPDAFGGIDYHAVLQSRGGLPHYNWAITGGSLPLGLSHTFFPGHILGTPVAFCNPTTSTFDVQVTDADVPPQTASRQGITLTVFKSPLSMPVASLPVGRVSVAYSTFIRPALGVAPYSFAVTGGALPSQLAINAGTGEIFGIPDTAGIATFTIQATDACGTTATGTFNLVIGTAPQGRNDSIATATAIGNGGFFASISPSGDPNTVFAPDQDYYSITTFAASTITIDLDSGSSAIDTVIELVDANGVRLSSCVPPTYASACVNDDQVPGSELDSYLEVQVPGPTTFYLRVVDWRFDARPDLTYSVIISGVN